MHTVQTMQMAGAFENIGDHLFTLGTNWAQAALRLALLVLIVVKVAQKFSVKAGIGAVIGYVLILGIYHSQEPLAKAFIDEITSVGAPAHVVRVDDRGAVPITPSGVADPASGDRT